MWSLCVFTIQWIHIIAYGTSVIVQKTQEELCAIEQKHNNSIEWYCDMYTGSEICQNWEVIC